MIYCADVEWSYNDHPEFNNTNKSTMPSTIIVPSLSEMWKQSRPFAGRRHVVSAITRSTVVVVTVVIIGRIHLDELIS